MSLTLPPPPALPNGPEREYDRQYQDQLNKILRIYFNQLNGVVSSLIGRLGGQYLNAPAAAIHRSTDALFTANTATQITFNANDFLNGCENDGTDGITVLQSGVYNYQFSVQFANTDTQAHSAWIWLRKGGVDVPDTASKWDIPSKHGSSDGYIIAAANFFVDLQEADTVEMMAAVSQAYVPGVTAGVYMEAYPVQTTPFAMPAVPSVVATLSFVSSVLPT